MEPDDPKRPAMVAPQEFYIVIDGNGDAWEAPTLEEAEASLREEIERLTQHALAEHGVGWRCDYPKVLGIYRCERVRRTEWIDVAQAGDGTPDGERAARGGWRGISRLRVVDEL